MLIRSDYLSTTGDTDSSVRLRKEVLTLFKDGEAACLLGCMILDGKLQVEGKAQKTWYHRYLEHMRGEQVSQPISQKDVREYFEMALQRGNFPEGSYCMGKLNLEIGMSPELYKVHNDGNGNYFGKPKSKREEKIIKKAGKDALKYFDDAAKIAWQVLFLNSV